MSNHIFCNIYRYMSSSIMNCEGMTYEGWEDSRTAGPCLNNTLVAGLIHRIYFFNKLASANGPFFNERAMSYLLNYLTFFPSLVLTINLLECLFFFLVFKPSAGLPHGVHGPGRPILALPSPPPCG